MNQKVLYGINKSQAKLVIFDIDGTLKDLCQEHTNALRLTLKQYNVSKISSWFVLLINKVAMAMVKTGMFATNKRKQNLLLKVFGVMSCVKLDKFLDKYYENYAKQVELFDGTYELLNKIGLKKVVYFSTINKQNYNLESYGISQDRIVYTNRYFKVSAYKQILKAVNVQKQDVIVVGDNIFDDILSAKLLGVKCFLVNHYNSKLKKVFCRLINGKYLK